MPKVIRDLSDTSSYWAAIWTMCAMPDVHVICDAPIGCYNLVATAVSNYTDVLPNINNVTPSVIREQEVGGSGTGPAVMKTYEAMQEQGDLEGKHLIVVSTAESEMIGSDLSDLVTKLKPGTTFFHSESLSDDEWLGRDRVLQWLWENYGEAQSAGLEVEAGLVNIIGPTYGCFNAPSDLHEIRRLIEGAGGRINVVYPYETTLSNTAQLARAQLNVVLYKEFGHTLATSLGQPWLHAPMGIRQTTEFVEKIGRLLGTEETARAFIQREKQTTLKAVWDLWKGPQSDWFATTNIGLVACGTYVDGLKAFLGDEMGMPVALAASRPLRPGELDNEGVRQQLHKNAPAFVFGSINEKIYLSEAGARHTNFIPAAFPGPIVRRSVGTPFMGYRGTVYLLQEIVNRLYEVLFNFLPVDTAYAQSRGSGGSNGVSKASAEQPGNLPWQPEAKARLDTALEQIPFMSRISASREIQMQVESMAHQGALKEVSLDLIETVLASRQN